MLPLSTIAGRGAPAAASNCVCPGRPAGAMWTGKMAEKSPRKQAVSLAFPKCSSRPA
ncbi:hypothetical protein SAMCFNEI73_Ch0331 [Sinorhizobium americanum]|uniref:Uncharacterized protein n=1 Tax=Sinorhizobium americanum TaxID=194963 RepID=A0A1L3LI13_9HYPH|nr:hypothetical protein SAMCCGM7_Ch0332 [Sinorhizobium americanum CCGM7]APG89663.1 hypothetical protein SAMCFNEI73_Ch0331 [Sinorhizobium americanum]